jgi:hypothetical protein
MAIAADFKRQAEYCASIPQFLDLADKDDRRGDR